MLDLDLTGVTETGGALEPGEYTVMADEAEVRDSKSGGQYINVKFKTTRGPYVFHMFNIKNDNAKAVEIGLGQLKTFMRVSGLDATKLNDVNALVGATCNVTTKIDDRGYAKIKTFKEAPKEIKQTATNSGAGF